MMLISELSKVRGTRRFFRYTDWSSATECERAPANKWVYHCSACNNKCSKGSSAGREKERERERARGRKVDSAREGERTHKVPDFAAKSGENNGAIFLRRRRAAYLPGRRTGRRGRNRAKSARRLADWPEVGNARGSAACKVSKDENSAVAAAAAAAAATVGH